jgi:hypothetical protein
MASDKLPAPDDATPVPDDDSDPEDTPLYVPSELVDAHYAEGDHASNPADRTGL